LAEVIVPIVGTGNPVKRGNEHADIPYDFATWKGDVSPIAQLLLSKQLYCQKSSTRKAIENGLPNVSGIRRDDIGDLPPMKNLAINQRFDLVALR
jgi:hypothetical protein